MLCFSYMKDSGTHEKRKKQNISKQEQNQSQWIIFLSTRLTWQPLLYHLCYLLSVSVCCFLAAAL